MKHITTRNNSDGRIRYYFRRRGLPALRLSGGPGEDPFEKQYAFACSIPLPKKGQPAIKAKELQRHLQQMDPTWQRQQHARRLGKTVRTRAAQQYRVPCEIDARWILQRIIKQGDRCAVSGVAFSYDRGLPTKDGRNPRAPSVDRVDCSKGYVPSNCRIVLLAVNVALNLWGDAQFIEICRRTIEHQDSRLCNDQGAGYTEVPVTRPESPQKPGISIDGGGHVRPSMRLISQGLFV